MAEAVNHPDHYGGAEKKSAAVEDLRKAAWYLQREIEKRTASSSA
jgi:hypothetical protein